MYEAVEGPTLLSLLEGLAAEGLRAPAALVHEWASLVVEAVAKAHEFGLVLGDVKPSNLVLADERMKLIDLEL